MKRFRLTAFRADEDELHVAVRRALEILVAPPGEVSANGVLWHSNELRNAASAIEGASRKQRGCVAGVPDLTIYHDGRVLLIELKTGDGALSDAQKKLHPRMRGAGIPVVVCRSVEAVLAALDDHRVPRRCGAVAA